MKTKLKRKYCKFCNKIFFFYLSKAKKHKRGKYCCRECYLKDKYKEYVCVICSKKFSSLHGYKLSKKYCCIECASKGKAKEWKIAREACLFRDNYTCQDCGIKKGQIRNGKPVKLEVHHKDETGSNVPTKEMNNDLGNLITLCHRCHIQEEIKLKGTFKKITGDKFKRNNDIFNMIKNGKSQVEISKMMGITRQRVSQIINFNF